MSTPQKKGNRANAALPNTPQNPKNEVEVTFVKQAANKPRIDIRNLPYSKEGIGDIFLMSKGKANAAKKADTKSAGNAPNASKEKNTATDRGSHAEIIKRLKSYTSQATSRNLSELEVQTLAKLLLKAIAPTAEMVFLKDSSEERFKATETFANFTEEEHIRTGDHIGELVTKVSMAIGKELGYFMADNHYDYPTPEVLNAFFESNNLPPDLFTKGIVLCHIFIIEFIAQGCHPAVILLATDRILQTPEKLASAIHVAAQYFYNLAKINGR